MVLKVVSPFSGELVCELPHDEGQGLDRKVERAVMAQRAWRAVPLDERLLRVRAGLEHFRRAADEIARDVTRQMGKPIVEARREVATMLGRAEHALEIAAQALAPDVVPSADGVVRRIEHAPLGVVLELSAWNYPLLITVNVVVPALLAGNSVLLKHSARTPLCGQHFARAFGALEPADLVTDLVLTHEATAGLLRDPRVAHVVFTGSVEGGRQVYRETSHRFVDAGLELGGKDPAYVAEDADLDVAVPGVVDGACYNAGQSCCAVERVYVHKARYQEFIERAQAELERYRLGDPLDEATTMGPLASPDALDLLEAQAADATHRGARLLLGGRRSECGRFFPPTLLVGCPTDAPVMQDESFGPIVPVQRVSDDATALQRMNDSRYGLTASVWTKDRARAERFARDLEAGTVFQNRCDFVDPALPWTGWKDSGKGSTLSRHGFWHLTRRKSVHLVP